MQLQERKENVFLVTSYTFFIKSNKGKFIMEKNIHFLFVEIYLKSLILHGRKQCDLKLEKTHH